MSYSAPRGAPYNTPRGYTSSEAARIVGISYRQLDYWSRTDLVSPTQEAHGSGSRRGYSYRDLVELFIVKTMLDAGIYLPATRKIMRVLRGYPELDLARTTLVFSCDTVRLCDQSELVEIVRTEQAMLNVLPLGGIMESLDNKLHEEMLVVAQG
jgi:DNA-binding transcriptional MerR regulator